MARSLYSEQLAALQGFSGTYTYTVASGFRVVLRDLDASYDGVSGTELRLLGSAGQTIDRWHGTIADEGPHQWRGRQVIRSGESFQVTTTDATDVTISGYVLSEP